MLTNPLNAFKGQSTSLNMVPVDNVRYAFISVCYSNFVRKRRAIFEIFDFKNSVTLKTGLAVKSLPDKSRKQHHRYVWQLMPNYLRQY